MLAPTIMALKKLINICELNAAVYDIKFKYSKNKYMFDIGREYVSFNTDIFIDGDKVEQVTSADHLGHKLSIVNKKYIYYG